MRQIKNPQYGIDYNRGDVLFMHTDGSFIAEGISILQNIQEETDFAELLGLKDKDDNPSHVVLVVNAVEGLESSIGGVQVCKLKKYFNNTNCIVIARVPYGITPQSEDDAISYGYSMIGKQYGYSAILGAAIFILSPFRRILPSGNKWPLFLGGEDIPFCSQFISDCERHTKLYSDELIFKDYHITKIFPNILWNHFPWEALR